MNIKRTSLLLPVLLSGCLGVWDKDRQAWLDAHNEGTDTFLPTECADSDDDCDGYSAGEDCDDADSDIHPGAEEVPYDGVDQDCDDEDLTDVDGDGYDGEPAGGDDCDDENPDANPGALEIPCNDVDEDCDTTVNTDGMAASFATSGMAPVDVDIAWDAAGRRVVAFFSGEDDGSCSQDTLRYTSFAENLELLADWDVTPDGGLDSSGLIAASVATDGTPRAVAYNACSGSILALEPSTADETEWDRTPLAQGVGTVTALDACAPDDADDLHVAYVAGGVVYFGHPDGSGHTWDSTTASSGSFEGLDLACASTDEARLASNTSAGLVATSYDISGGHFGSSANVDRSAGPPIGAHGSGGAPWVLRWDDGGTLEMSYSEGSAFSDVTTLPGYDASAGLASSGLAVSDGGIAYLGLIDDNGAFYLVRQDLETLDGTILPDASLVRSYADVAVDEDGRAWYLYGSDSGYKLGVLCPE